MGFFSFKREFTLMLLLHEFTILCFMSISNSNTVAHSQCCHNIIRRKSISSAPGLMWLNSQQLIGQVAFPFLNTMITLKGGLISLTNWFPTSATSIHRVTERSLHYWVGLNGRTLMLISYITLCMRLNFYRNFLFECAIVLLGIRREWSQSDLHARAH